MKKWILKYANLSFEEKIVFSTKFSIFLNLLTALFKILLSIFEGFFLLISGILNIIFLLSKFECYNGIKKPLDKTFKNRNFKTGMLLVASGIIYAIYMLRLLIVDNSSDDYGMIISIAIAFVSFTEMIIAIIGCFKVKKSGHYYRNIKIINLATAFTAIVLTEVALMNFASDSDSSFINAMFGLIVGGIIILLGVFIIIAPIFSIIDKEKNIYKAVSKVEKKHIIVHLTNSKIYSNYYYEANINNNIVIGYIKKTESPIKKWNIFIKIIVIILSEILIFIYGIGALISYFKNKNIVKKLDYIMEEKGFIKIEEESLC